MKITTILSAVALSAATLFAAAPMASADETGTQPVINVPAQRVESEAVVTGRAASVAVQVIESGNVETLAIRVFVDDVLHSGGDLSDGANLLARVRFPRGTGKHVVTVENGQSVIERVVVRTGRR